MKAYELASDNQSKELEEAMTNLKGNDRIEKAKQIFDEIGVKSYAEEVKSQYYNEALKNMNTIDVPDENKASLLGLAQFLMKRDH